MPGTLGIRREDRNPWERRAPLAPAHVEKLVKEHGIRVFVQPSDIRVFTDDEYRTAGAAIQEDIWDCDVVFAVKEIPKENFRDGGAYIYFSHTIKGQDYNMPMLKRLVEKKCHLMDYEKVTDENNRRLIFFGREAGLAGMINTLWAMGQRLSWEGHITPLADIIRCKDYSGLADAKNAIAMVGGRIEKEGMPEDTTPLICGFAGYGNVSRGAQEIYDVLPVVELTPGELVERGEAGTLKDLPPNKVYKVVFKEEHMVVPKDPDGKFELQDYYDQPEKYDGVFEQYLPHMGMLVNCIYWDERYPRLVTNEWCRANYPIDGKPGTKLRVIGDISCDIDGSVQPTVKATDPGAPIFVFDPHQEKETDGHKGLGPVVLAVDALPSTLPRDATEAFGDMLLDYIPQIMDNDFSKSPEDFTLPPDFDRALVLAHGEFRPDFEYMSEYI